ncbi:MAG: hypothetical protein ACF8AM_02955 [Rhodopirellula sp. JB055]|uniref:hypothetical protein n=1 Tax=Rhodopirellula sp. JB055 TaxID=3342846 RepID=UPI00370CCBE4
MRPIRRPNTRALRCLAAIACICFCLASQTSDAAITWNLTYEDIDNNTGNGFDDVASGAARRSVFEAALDYVSDVLNENGSVNLTIRQSLTSGTGALASAGSSYFFGGGFQQGLVQQNILNVSPGNTISGSHGSARFDFGYSWNESLAAPATGEFDLFSVSLHENTHAIGFASLTNADGTSPIGPSPATDNTYSNFDQYLRLDDGTELFNASGEFIGDASDLTSNSVVFDGTNAVAANGGSLVEIYSPATFNDGSSMSHIVSANSVMQYSIAPNVLRRTYSDIEIGILQDIGYVNASATAVPEPTSSGLAFVLMIGLFARRQSKRSPRQ